MVKFLTFCSLHHASGLLEKRTYFYLGFSLVIFSTAMFFTKEILPPLNAISYLVLRSMFGTLLLLFILGFKKQLGEFWQFFRSNRNSLLVLSVVLYAGSNLIMYFGTPYTNATNQLILQNIVTILIIAANFFIYHKKSTPLAIFAALVMIPGMVLVIWPLSFSQNTRLIGDILTILSNFLAVFFVFKTKELAKPNTILFLSLAMSMLTMIFLFPFIFLSPNLSGISVLTRRDWEIIIWLGICISGIGYSINAAIYTDKNITPEFIGFFSGLTTLTGFLLGIWIFSEPLSPINILGCLIVIGAIFFGSQAKQKENQEKTE